MTPPAPAPEPPCPRCDQDNLEWVAASPEDGPGRWWCSYCQRHFTAGAGGIVWASGAPAAPSPALAEPDDPAMREACRLTAAWIGREFFRGLPPDGSPWSSDPLRRALTALRDELLQRAEAAYVRGTRDAD